MRLVAAIVPKAEAEALARRLAERGFQGTRLPALGSFTGEEREAFWIGVEPERLEELKALVAEVTSAEEGAVVFVLEVLELLRL